MSEPHAQPFDKTRRRAAIAVAALAGALAVLAGIYGIGRLRGNPGETACRPAVELARRIAPLAHGEIAALAVAQKPFRVPELVFKDADGRARNIRDWRGRTVLLNLWATWCVPCRREMPALDALEAKLGGPDFEVVAINIDTRDPDKPRAWFNEVGLKHLAYYADPNAKAFQELKLAGKAFGMPTTMLIDRAGCEIGTLAGPAEWASEDAVKLVQASLRQEAPQTRAQ
jgi:thiol-disulfide isomerase/thioredoxin